MTELDSPFFIPYGGSSCCFYCKKKEDDLFIDLYKKAKAKKEYVLCREHTKNRGEHYLNLINKEGREDIVKIVEETRNKLITNNLKNKKPPIILLEEDDERRAEYERKQAEENRPTLEERKQGLEQLQAARLGLELEMPELVRLKSDEKYWKENYADTPKECHYCKEPFEYLATKEEIEVKFCRKHYHERVEMEGINSPFRTCNFRWVGGNKEQN